MHAAEVMLESCPSRALVKEVGGTKELQRALQGEGGWKGRARQIVMLKARVKQLEGQLRDDERVSKDECANVFAAPSSETTCSRLLAVYTYITWRSWIGGCMSTLLKKRTESGR